MFNTVVVASLCRSVGRRSKRWSRVAVGNGKRTWRRRGLSCRVAPWTPIASVGAERSRPAGCWSWEAGFMPPAGGQWVSSRAAAHHSIYEPIERFRTGQKRPVNTSGTVTCKGQARASKPRTPNPKSESINPIS
jgi:hypothetical protein